MYSIFLYLKFIFSISGYLGQFLFGWSLSQGKILAEKKEPDFL